MREQFEALLLEDPDDPEPYAVYADWLSERGDPRGEFILVQLALEDQTRPEAERRALSRRQQELLTAHQREWCGSLWPTLVDEHSGPEFERGFLRELYPFDNFDESALRTLRDWSDRRFLKELTFNESSLHQEQIEALLEGVQFESLRFLQIGEEIDLDMFLIGMHGPGCRCYFDPVLALVEHMPYLEELHLLCKGYNVEGLFSQYLPRLRVLRLYHCGDLHTDGNECPLSVLALNPGFENLTHLQIHPHYRGYSYLPLSQVEALVRSKYLRSLTHLELRLSDMGDAGCRLLAESGMLDQLEGLDLRHGCVTDEGARILANHPTTRRLSLLDLQGNALSEEGVALLMSLGPFVRAGHQMNAQQIADSSYLYAGDFE